MIVHCKERLGERGSLLIFTLWVLVMVSIFTMAVGYQTRQRLRFLQSIEYREQLRTAVDAGILKAAQTIRMQTDSGDDESVSGLGAWRLNGTFRKTALGQAYFTIRYQDTDRQWVYGLQDEERKMNLNEVTAVHPLKTLIKTATGLEDSAAGDLAASILDWKDEDDVLNAGGAETRYYRLQSPAYSAKNAAFDSLEELMLVKGMNAQIYSLLAPHLSLYAASEINLNTAAEPVLLAQGMSENLTAKILEYRAGKDRLMMTDDDRLFPDMATAVSTLKNAVAISTSEKEAIETFLTSGVFDVKPMHFTVRVEGHLENRKESLEKICVLDSSGSVLTCREFFYRETSDNAEEGDI